jgi:hypothetical protein
VAINAESDIFDHTHTEQLVEAVSELAQRDPRQARRAIETVAAHLDEATEGKRTKELARLEAAALEALGLDAKHMVAAVDEGPAAPSDTQG